MSRVLILQGSPRRRSPSPTGKVDRAQPGPDEGKQPKSEKQATLNGSVFHSMWPVSLLGCGPSSVTPYGVPPSPWGKATSRRGIPYLPRGGRRPPAGAALTFPWGKVPPQRRKRGRLPCVKGAVSPWLTEGSPCCRLGPPHTRQGFALPPSPRRG